MSLCSGELPRRQFRCQIGRLVHLTDFLDCLRFGYTSYAFDYVPTNFAKELLIHEAHRHPYIERLAQAYLMRFRHKKRFGSSAGAVWRHIFVQTLMPWMRKHRVFSQVRLKQSMEALAINRKIADEDAKGIFERFREDMDAAKDSALEATGELVNIARLTGGTTEVNQLDDSMQNTISVLKSPEEDEQEKDEEGSKS